MPAECIICRQKMASFKHADFDVCADCEEEAESVDIVEEEEETIEH